MSKLRSTNRYTSKKNGFNQLVELVSKHGQNCTIKMVNVISDAYDGRYGDYRRELIDTINSLNIFREDFEGYDRQEITVNVVRYIVPYDDRIRWKLTVEGDKFYIDNHTFCMASIYFEAKNLEEDNYSLRGYSVEYEVYPRRHIG